MLILAAIAVLSWCFYDTDWAGLGCLSLLPVPWLGAATRWRAVGLGAILGILAVAMRSAGAPPLQVFQWGVLPQVRVALTGIAIYTWVSAILLVSIAMVLLAATASGGLPPEACLMSLMRS